MPRRLLIASCLFALLFFAGCGGNAAMSAGSASGGSGSGGGTGSGGGSGNGGGSEGSGGGNTTPNTSCAMTAGQGASLNGFIPFTSDSPWNQDISSAAVDPNSSQIINFIGPTIGLHPDFGAGQFQGSTIGIPYTVVDGTQGTVSINFNQSADESDPGPMPIPASAPIEGYPNPGNGDRHVLVLDNSNCFLYELYASSANSNGSWTAGSGAVWDLLGNEQRPWTWTSADAAGLPIFSGLVRYDEVAAGKIQHALRFTLNDSRAAFIPPASHWAANSTNSLAAPWACACV